MSVDTFSFAVPDDCGADDITGWLVDTIAYTGPVKTLVITAPSPWTWIFAELNAYAKLFYTQEFYELPPPTDTCVTGDPLLDTPAMRSLLRKLRDSSNWSDPVKTNRREKGGYVSQLPSGDLVPKTFFTAADEWCNTPIPASVPGPGEKYLAIAHLHPFKPLEPLPTGICGIPPKFWPPGWANNGRPSDPDIVRVQDDSAYLGYPLWGYVVDKDSVYAMPPGTTVKNRKQKVKGYPIISPVNGCSLL